MLVVAGSANGQREVSRTAKDNLAAQINESQRYQPIAYDRLEVLSRFLRTVYPDLDGEQGLSTLRVGFVGGMFHMASFGLEFHPCRMSGVSATSVQRGQAPSPPPIPYCGVPQSPGDKPFLNVSVGLGADRHRPFIFGFNASGSFINGKLQTIRDQFKDRVHEERDFRDKQRYWTKDDALKALQSTNPKYGPDHKKEFLASVPIQAIQETTGCKLRMESAEFVILFLNTPPQLEWSVHGDAAATEASAAGNCWALFEPFDGHLTAMGF
jgi:hypothetical protein